MSDKAIGVHTTDFFNHVGFKTGASRFSELGIVQVPTKTVAPSAPTLTALAAPGSSVGVIEATVTLPTTNATDGSLLVRAEIEDIALHYKSAPGVTTADPFVIFSARETLPWSPGDTNTWYVKVRVRDTHGNWSELSNEMSAAASDVQPESLGLWAHRLSSASVFTDNSPGAGEVAWSNVILYWKDNKYTIVAGNTDKKYIWWDYSLSTTTFQVTDTLPTLEQEDVIIGYNDGGTWRLMVYAPTVMADYIRAGKLQSSNWATDAGSEFDLDAGTVKLGGSSDPHFSVDASGNMVSKSGTIAGFTIDGTEGLYAGVDATRIQMKVGVGLWLGATDFASAPFRVNPAGAITVSNLTVTGGTWGGSVLDTAKIPNLDATKITTGVLVVARTEAKCTVANADHTADIVGAMAYEDLVESAKLGTTIISGGYLKTEFLTADNVQAGTLKGRTVRTAASDPSASMISSGGYVHMFIITNSASGVTSIVKGGEIDLQEKNTAANRITINAGATAASVPTITLTGGTSVGSLITGQSGHRIDLRYCDLELATSTVTGTLTTTNIPNLDATKITTGVLNTAHLPVTISKAGLTLRASSGTLALSAASGAITVTSESTYNITLTSGLDVNLDGRYVRIYVGTGSDYVRFDSMATTGGAWGHGYINILLNGVARSIVIDNPY